MQKIASILRNLSWGDVVGMTLVMVLFGVFAPMFLSVDVPFAQTVGYAAGLLCGAAALIAVFMAFVVIYFSR